MSRRATQTQQPQKTNRFGVLVSLRLLLFVSVITIVIGNTFVWVDKVTKFVRVILGY
jgi:hypothetical protein